MSAVSSRPRVHRVSSSLVTAESAGALVLAGRALRDMLARMDADVAKGFMESPADLGAARDLMSLSQSRARFEDALRAASPPAGLASTAALKLSALTAINAAAFAASAAVCQAALQPLLVASTPQAVADARQQAVATLMEAHSHTLTQGLVTACETASRTLGFDQVEVRPAIIGKGVRVLALNADGRTMVSEIGSTAGGDVEVQTEVIGVTDGSCQALLDRFDAEMARLGVAADPVRRSTGGVCQLAAAREFIKRLPVRQRPGLSTRASQPAPRRTVLHDAAVNKGGSK